MRKVLVVGGGGREHAILWKLKQGNEALELFCAPGNGGIAELATCVPIKADDVEGMVTWSKENGMDLVFVAPDDPLALGMVDALQEADIRAFGPTKAAAEIEWSKSYSKWLMKKYGIPTAAFEVFDDADKAIRYLSEANYPIVVKADGLALGKGVLICDDFEQAKQAVQEIMLDKKFGAAGAQVVIEEFMTGPEVSVLAFCDGKTILPMVSAQDHKRAYDGDEGLNTGGMGTFAPSPKFTPELQEYARKVIFEKTVEALNAEGRIFKGVIFFGLMITPDGLKVLEYNARLGDPEAQSVFMMMDTDLMEVVDAVIDGTLDQVSFQWKDGNAVCVVMASGGYPQKYESGKLIEGLDDVEDSVMVFHAGTKLGEDGRLYTNGGRVLGVTAAGRDIQHAREIAYRNIEKIRFEGAHYRKDIGIK
ncbi:phosphoribosylamine--glycine ligase [Christensenella tenuis]|jgi:phosphoribosylamine---glycine ligase|uniref:Phosphoribosylamine--glycine ligase n=1 Tax=Christensenella tenuis TaxID=2763033 RepID=A0ABR7EB43_9FIRM|nr:phosphoribosylamine--glycine ligase [Christensenella tenuis]MBC5646994.1 phosphoribosylamine--glycine ligase [Christensenella tenuis]